MCYLFTVRMPKFISETFLKTGKRRHLDDKNESKEEEEILNTCIVCKQKISSGRNGLDQFDVKYHYTECYIQEGKFSETLEKIGGSVTEKRENKYRCLVTSMHDRPMFCKDYLLHMGIVHNETKEIMRRDSRPGIDKIISFCYSGNANKNTKNNPIKKEAAVPVIETNNASFPLHRHDIISAVEEEDVDDPSEDAGDVAGLNPPPSKIIKTDPELDDNKVVKPNRFQRCLICRKSDQFLISTNNAKEYLPLMWHYADCLFEKKMFQNIIDPGPDNIDDNRGARFKYKCPVATCPDNTSKNRNGQSMGLKSYSMHCAVFHNQLEVALAQYNTEGIEEVREAVLHHRKLSKAPPVTMPKKVLVEEFHACVLCKDDSTGKEATKLSFSNPSSLKYHYAGCYYDNDIEVMLRKYPPGQDNFNQETGRPIDEIGTRDKYPCLMPSCKKDKKNSFSYKTLCIHMSVMHGGLMEIMESDTTAGIRYVYDKLQSLI